ncbi:MAG: hypothetical protein U0637_02360 [Phycisphaerales bacterium]
MKQTSARWCTLLALTLAAHAAWARSQQSTPPAPPAESKPDAKPQDKPSDNQPSLDDLLGITRPRPPQDDKPATTPAPAPQGGTPKDSTRADLDRRLASDQVSDDFVQAVSMMRDTSERLTTAGDVGLETQRLQQEVLRRLDKLIDDAKKQQQSSKKQSKSQQQSQDQDQQQNQQQKQSSQQQKPQAQQAGANAQGGNVPRQNADLKAPPAGASASWGDLPPHVRDALMQGFSDKFSATYEQLTQEYYKRLAEQKPAPAPTPGGSK